MKPENYTKPLMHISVGKQNRNRQLWLFLILAINILPFGLKAQIKDIGLPFINN